MLNRRTVKIFTGLWAGVCAAVSPAWVGPAFLQELSSDIYLTPIWPFIFSTTWVLPAWSNTAGLAAGRYAPPPLRLGISHRVLVGVACCVAWGLARLTLRSRARAGVAPPRAGR